MKIKNEYVQIKQGNKTYTKRNMILNKYLKGLLDNQIDAVHSNSTNINQCYIKLDTPLENVDYDSVLYASNFDVVLYKSSTNFLGNESKEFKRIATTSNDNIIMRYKFTEDGLFRYDNDFYLMNEFSKFNGRKVCTIGFGGDNKCYAVVDVSNMNIILNTNEEFIISRVDLLQSDGECKGFAYPLHLVNFNAYYDVNQLGNEYTIARLYSIGLGNKVGLMESEQIIDFEQVDRQDNSITIDFSELIKVGHYPSETLFPGFYPTMDNSKYLILKYRLYRMDIGDLEQPLDEYYTMSYKYDLSKYENQTKNISFTLSIERM